MVLGDGYMKEKINEILLSGKVLENRDFLLTVIPELRFMVGFSHKHPHHHLDVWEHTLEVVRNVADKDLDVKLAALLHDVGKPFSYQEGEIRHFHGHPEVSATMTQNILSRLEYDEEFIRTVVYLVRMHDTPIDPENLDNDFSIVEKRLQLQYADALAHHPDKVQKRLDKLEVIKVALEQKKPKVKVVRKEEEV